MSTARIAMKECAKCHYRYPVNEMYKETVEKRTGSSIGGYGLGKGGKPRASGRLYYRKMDVWTCKACWDAHQAKLSTKIGNFIALIFGWGILIGIVWLIVWISTAMVCDSQPPSNNLFSLIAYLFSCIQ